MSVVLKVQSLSMTTSLVLSSRGMPGTWDRPPAFQIHISFFLFFHWPVVREEPTPTIQQAQQVQKAQQVPQVQQAQAVQQPPQVPQPQQPPKAPQTQPPQQVQQGQQTPQAQQAQQLPLPAQHPQQPPQQAQQTAQAQQTPQQAQQAQQAQRRSAVFLSFKPPIPCLPLRWEQQSKLLPTVAGIPASRVSKWSTDEVCLLSLLYVVVIFDLQCKGIGLMSGKCIYWVESSLLEK